MDLRPSAARWFEVVVPRVDADDALEALARRGGVEFQWTGGKGAGGQIEPLRGPLARYHALAADHAGHWPEPVFAKRCCVLPIEAAAGAAIRQLERWRQGAEPLLAALAAARQEREGLELWRRLLPALQGRPLDLKALTEAGPALAAYCLVLPAAAEPPDGAAPVELAIPLSDRCARIGLVAREAAAALCERARARGGTCLPLPDWLTTAVRGRGEAVSERGAELDRRISQLGAELRALAEERGVAHARGVLERIDWFCRTAQDIRCDGDDCWITGWTGEVDAAAVERTLGDAGVSAAVAFPDPPVDAPSPSVSRNPVWLRPFEVFTRAVGVPGVREADPTTWVALLVPLMFGYMCGDVGHGAAGLMLRRRTPLWPLLVVCGLAAVGFGFVYGDVFGYEHLIPALWVRPLEEPLLVLAVPVAAGALILTLGVLLHLVQTCWRGEGGSRGVADVAQLLVYWGLLLAFVDLRLGWLALAGVALCLGNRLWTERQALALFAGLGHLVQGRAIA